MRLIRLCFIYYNIERAHIYVPDTQQSLTLFQFIGKLDVFFLTLPWRDGSQIVSGKKPAARHVPGLRIDASQPPNISR